MCNDAPAPPDFTSIAKAMGDIGTQMNALGEKQMRFGQQRYDETMPFYQRMMQSNLEGQQQSMQLAADSAQDRQKYRALEDQFVTDAMGTDRGSYRNQMAGRAASDVEQATATARASAVRNLSRMGINPNAARFADLNNQISMTTAAAKAGAMTNARIGADQMLDQKKLAAISLGRNLPAQQLSAISTGSGVGNSNAGLFGAQSAPMLQGFQGAMSGMQGALGAQGQIGNFMQQGYKNQMDAYNSEGGAMGQFGQLLGAGAKMYGASMGIPMMANGGQITGPGTGTSDSIMALNQDSGEQIRLSNGEYVLPADTVRKVGKESLDRLVKTTHKPVRRQAIRRN